MRLTASLEHCLESSLDSTLGEISYIFSFIFYNSIKVIIEAKWISSGDNLVDAITKAKPY